MYYHYLQLELYLPRGNRNSTYEVAAGRGSFASKRDNSTEILVARVIFAVAKFLFAETTLSPQSSRSLCRIYGVLAFPVKPFWLASETACSIATFISSEGTANFSGMGLANMRPDSIPSRSCAKIIDAASLSVLTTDGLLMPLSLAQNAGKSILPVRPSANVETTQPCVSRYSRVRGMSRNPLQPLLMTATRVRPSSVRSAEISMEFSPPL